MVSKDSIVKSARTAGCARWYIKAHNQTAKGNKAAMFRHHTAMGIEDPTGENIDIDLDSSMAALDHCLNSITGSGKYVVKFWKNEGEASTNFQELPFLASDGQGSSYQNPRIAGAGNQNNPFLGSAESIGALIDEKVEAKWNARRIEELERENEELKEAVEDPSGLSTQLAKTVGYVNDNAPDVWLGVLGTIMGIFKKAPAANLAGGGYQEAPIKPQQVEQLNNINMSTENQEKFEEELDQEFPQVAPLIARLKMIDPNYIKTLTTLVEKVEKNPGLLKLIDSI